MHLTIACTGVSWRDLFFFFYGETRLRWKHGDSLVVLSFPQVQWEAEPVYGTSSHLDSGDTLPLSAFKIGLQTLLFHKTFS